MADDATGGTVVSGDTEASVSRETLATDSAEPAEPPTRPEGPAPKATAGDKLAARTGAKKATAAAKRPSGGARRTAANAKKRTQEQRTNTVAGVQALVVQALALGAIGAGGTDPDLAHALGADAALISGPQGDALVKAIVAAADDSERLAQLLDGAGFSSPWLTVAVAAWPLALGIAGNHGIGISNALGSPSE